jgi:vacuolar-type H+-ATPase subunit I/STV1
MLLRGWDYSKIVRDRTGTMMSRGFYTLAEAAQILEVTQRRLLKMLQTGEVEGERDSLSSRWKIPKHTVQELVTEPVSDDPSSENPAEQSSDQSTESVHQLVEELGNLQGELGRLRNRLELARQVEHTAWREEKEHLLAELEQERERRRQEREEAESTLRAEQERWQKERDKLREELETERNKGSWRRLLGG